MAIILWQSMVYKLLLNLIGSLLLYSEFILHWFVFYGTFEQLILYWYTFHGIFDGFVSKLCSQMLQLSHTVHVAHHVAAVMIWGQPGSTTLLLSLKRRKTIQWCTSYFCYLLFICLRFTLGWFSSRKCVIWVCTYMRDEYHQQDGVGLGPLHELADLTFNWTLQALKKHLYHSCRKDVVSA